MEKILHSKNSLKGEVKILGDKSISHRAIILGSISEGETKIENFLKSGDCISTIECFKNLGVEIEENGNKILVHGKGLYGLKKPKKDLYVGNSGTTVRLLSGLLAAQNFTTNITGDDSIKKRPMKRIIEPLVQMGAKIDSSFGLCPLKIEGRKLKGINYTLPIASAQVKSAILLASLYAEGKTKIIENIKTRNHSEIMLNNFGANITVQKNIIESSKIEKLTPKEIYVVSDISSASFFILAGIITPNSNILIKNVGLNETRIGFIKTLKDMGGNIKITEKKCLNGEYVGNIEVKSSKLKSINISNEVIPKMIDEIPLFALAASLAEGTSIVKDATELKFKESNRLKTITSELNKLGANILETKDGMIIKGVKNLKGGYCQSHKDHRIAMCLSIASLICEKKVILKDYECVDISFPNFFEILNTL